MIELRCDRCGKDIQRVSNIKEAMDRAEKASMCFSFNEEWHDVDLCDHCKMELAMWLSSMPAGCQRETRACEGKGETAAQRKRRSSLDDAKIAKLRQQGLTLQQIGDKMGVSNVTILDHLRKMGMK